MKDSAGLDGSKSIPSSSNSKANVSEQLTISTVIIARNAPDSIRYTLDSLNAQSRKPDEILVIVPSKEDPTVETAKEYRVRVVLDPKATRGSARAIGVKESRGNVVAFIDAKCIAHPEWLRALETVYLNNKEVLVQGGTIHRTLNLRNAKMDSTLPPIYPLHYVNFVPTANLSFRKEAANIAGNFNERLHEGEDLDFCIRLAEHKIGIVLNPAAVVLHLDKTTGSLMKRYSNYGKSRAKVFFFHKRYVLPAAIIATVQLALIPVAIWAFIAQRYDILLIAVGLPIFHQFYKFFRSEWQISDSTISAFLLDFVLSYTLYFSFFTRFLFLLFSPNLRGKTS